MTRRPTKTAAPVWHGHKTPGSLDPRQDLITDPGCALCQPALGPILFEGRFWRAVLNRNQSTLGKSFLATRRHVEDISGLTGEEWSELLPLTWRVRAGVGAVFAPDHWNAAFLMNQDRHVHLHLFPRYASSREFGALRFDDPEFGKHYDPSRVVRLPEDILSTLAQRLRAAVASV